MDHKQLGPAGRRQETLAWDRVRVTVVIPVFNERATVEQLLKLVREVPLLTEVVVVDDGSTDGICQRRTGLLVLSERSAAGLRDA